MCFDWLIDYFFTVYMYMYYMYMGSLTWSRNSLCVPQTWFYINNISLSIHRVCELQTTNWLQFSAIQAKPAIVFLWLSSLMCDRLGYYVYLNITNFMHICTLIFSLSLSLLYFYLGQSKQIILRIAQIDQNKYSPGIV